MSPAQLLPLRDYNPATIGHGVWEMTFTAMLGFSSEAGIRVAYWLNEHHVCELSKSFIMETCATREPTTQSLYSMKDFQHQFNTWTLENNPKLRIFYFYKELLTFSNMN